MICCKDSISNLFLKCIVCTIIKWLTFLQFHTHVCRNFTISDHISGEALGDLLKALNDSNRRIRDWDVHLVSPCYSWSHVTCVDGHVVTV